jgi:RHS repeat-associated protein
MVKGTGTYRLITDQLGSVRAVVRVSDGAVMQRTDYDAWGAITYDSSATFQSLAYAGGLMDRSTGLIRFGARDYDPGVGRWTCKDPVGFDGGLNQFEYAASTPVDLLDPDGLAVLNPGDYNVPPDVLDRLKKFNWLIGCDKDIVITGGDRAPGSALGAGANSFHAKHLAADFRVPGQSHLLTANQADKSGLFKGVGWYEEGYRGRNGEGPHVHVDLRSGPSARWGFPANGPAMRGHFPSVAVRFANRP